LEANAASLQKNAASLEANAAPLEDNTPDEASHNGGGVEHEVLVLFAASRPMPHA
jgi:hypothetical protein